MEVTILGSGTAIPIIDRASPSFALFVKKEPPMLLDAGPGTLRQLTRLGISHEAIGRIFLTHFHPDHCADLIHLFFATRNPRVLKRRKPFVLIGPSGLKDFVASLHRAFDASLELPQATIELRELNPGGGTDIDFGNFMPARIAGFNGKVTFRYKDYAREGTQRTMTLTAAEFIRRFLLHVLPDGFMRIRHYGYLANRHRREKLATCRRVLGCIAPSEPEADPETAADLPSAEPDGHLGETEPAILCPACKTGRMQTIDTFDRRPRTRERARPPSPRPSPSYRDTS